MNINWMKLQAISNTHELRSLALAACSKSCYVTHFSLDPNQILISLPSDNDGKEIKLYNH